MRRDRCGNSGRSGHPRLSAHRLNELTFFWGTKVNALPWRPFLFLAHHAGRNLVRAACLGRTLLASVKLLAEVGTLEPFDSNKLISCILDWNICHVQPPRLVVVCSKLYLVHALKLKQKEIKSISRKTQKRGFLLVAYYMRWSAP